MDDAVPVQMHPEDDMRRTVTDLAVLASFGVETAAMIDAMALGGAFLPRVAWAAVLVGFGLGAGLLARVRGSHDSGTGAPGIHRALHLVLMGGLLACMGTASSGSHGGMAMTDTSAGLEAALIACCLAVVATSLTSAVRARGRGRRRLRVEHSVSAAAMLAMLAMVVL